MFFPNRTVGDGTLIDKRVIAAGFARLVAIVGFNNGGADIYVQIHETATEPSAGAVPKFAFNASAGLPYSFALPAAVDMSAIYVAASSTLATYTATGATNVSIQGIVAG